jgi:hypothetical protein
MMNWKGFGSKWPWLNRGGIPLFSNVTEQIHEKLQSGQPMARPRSEPVTPEYKSSELLLFQFPWFGAIITDIISSHYKRTNGINIVNVMLLSHHF